jgi:hypothetical protein
MKTTPLTAALCLGALAVSAALGATLLNNPIAPSGKTLPASLNKVEVGAPEALPVRWIGEVVTLYFRTDAIGGGGEFGRILTDNHNGAQLSMTGALRAINDDWVSLDIRGAVNTRRVSFSRDAILAIAARPEAAQ